MTEIEEKISAYIEAMPCSRKEGYGAIGLPALADVAGLKPKDDYDEFLKSVKRVILRLKKKGLKISRSNNWIHRDG